MKLKKIDPNDLIKSLGNNFLKDLRTVLSVKDDDFKKKYLSLLYRLGEYVQELPLEREHFQELGGAFRFGALSAFFTIRMSGGILFSSSLAMEESNRLNWQYKYAAFAASIATVPVILYHNLNLCIDGREWSYLSTERLHKIIQTEYSFTWHKRLKDKDLTQMASTLVLRNFFDIGFGQDLDPQIVDELCRAINPSGALVVNETPLMALVRKGHEKARNAHTKENQPLYTENPLPTQSVHQLSTAIDLQQSQSVKPLADQPIVQTLSTSLDGNSPKHLTLPVINASAKPSNDFSRIFTDFVNVIKNDEEKYKTVLFNGNGTVSVPFNLFKGMGTKPNLLIEQFENLDLLVEVDRPNQLVRFKSTTTDFFMKVSNA